MEFVGNKISLKTIMATLIVAFLIGRINLFNGNFPAAIAFISVMIGISSVYIYLIPVLIGGMATWNFSDMYAMGDVLTIIFIGVFFLFFHNIRFKSCQKIAFALFACVVLNCVYYIWIHAVLMFNFLVLGKKLLAIIVFYQAFYLAGRVIFASSKRVDKESYIAAMEIISIAVLGALPLEEVVVCLWIFAALLWEYRAGLGKGIMALCICSIYAYLQGGYVDFPLFIATASGLVGGRCLADIVDRRYDKQFIAVIVFLCVYISGSQYLYAALIGLAVYAIIPKGFLFKMALRGKDVFWWNEDGVEKEKIAGMTCELKQKYKTFDALGKLYSGAMDEQQIISYQFQGMARVTKKLIQFMEGQSDSNNVSRRMITIPTGSASYSFEGISGDSQRAFYYGDKLAMVISDGMGKGKAASTESALVVNTLAQLLDAGFDVDLAMKTVNGILLAKKNKDIFATVDLALINRITGRTKIFKMGASTTFVKHKGKVVVIKQPALPAGVDSGLKLEYREVKLHRGDLLIMVSDGICDCDRQDPSCKWLIQRLEEMGTRDPNTVAELIVNKAAEKYQLRERDDLTVLVAGI